MPDSLDTMSLKISQMMQILDQYRMNIFNMDLRFQLLTKMLEEKGVFVKEEFAKRWPIFLKSDVGVVGQDGVMEGVLKVTFYGEGTGS